MTTAESTGYVETNERLRSEPILSLISSEIRLIAPTTNELPIMKARLLLEYPLVQSSGNPFSLSSSTGVNRLNRPSVDMFETRRTRAAFAGENGSGRPVQRIGKGDCSF